MDLTVVYVYKCIETLKSALNPLWAVSIEEMPTSPPFINMPDDKSPNYYYGIV